MMASILEKNSGKHVAKFNWLVKKMMCVDIKLSTDVWIGQYPFVDME